MENIITSVAVPARIIFASSAFIIVVIVLELIRRGYLKEKYILLWLPISIIFAVFGLFPDLLIFISTLLNLHYITVVLLSIIIGFSFIMLYLTLRLSKLRDDVKSLSQDIAIIKQKLKN